MGVGPSVRDPLQVARHLRSIGAEPLLVFFTSSSSARHALHAELVRDPFLYPRYELIDLPQNTRQLASRMGRFVANDESQLHDRQSQRRRRGRSRAPKSHPLGASSGDQHLLGLIANARDAIFAIDESGRVVTWNDAAQGLFGFTAEAVLGRSADFLDVPEVGADSPRQIGSVLRGVFASGQPEHTRVTCLCASGQRVRVAVSVAPIRDPSDAILGVSAIARDDLEYQRVEEALREANRQKDEFLAIMSHELRTPLTSIMGYTDMLLRGLSGPLAPLTTRYVGNVRAAGDRLLELVNGLLDYTRLEAGADRLEVHAINLMPLVKQAVQRFQKQAEGRRIDLHLVANQDVEQIQADGEKIDHVLKSFLGNALKFTPDGGWIAVRVGQDPDAHDAVRVSVADSGIGLRDEQVARVWERFYQGDASLTRPYGGMGLGLAIAQHLVRLHGGTVGAESAGPGLGSTFWFSLPLAQAS